MKDWNYHPPTCSLQSLLFNFSMNRPASRISWFGLLLLPKAILGIGSCQWNTALVEADRPTRLLPPVWITGSDESPSPLDHRHHRDVLFLTLVCSGLIWSWKPPYLPVHSNFLFRLGQDAPSLRRPFDSCASWSAVCPGFCSCRGKHQCLLLLLQQLTSDVEGQENLTGRGQVEDQKMTTESGWAVKRKPGQEGGVGAQWGADYV